MLELLPKTWEMWRLGGLTPRDALTRTWRAFRRHGLDGRSAQSAYYGLALIAPILILLLTVMSALPVEGLFESFAQETRSAVPEDVYEMLVAQVEDIRTRGGAGLVWLALGVFLFSGVKLFNSVSRALNAVHGVEERRRLWTLWSISLLLGAGSFLLLLVSALLMFFGPLLDLPFSEGLRVLIVIAAGLLGTSVIYWAMPSVRQRWMPLTPGNALAVGSWLLMSKLLKVFVDGFGNYNETYGALAGVILVMIWMHLSGVAFYFGAQLNATILDAMRTEERAPPLRGR
ncbi:MAG: YihY/virulence factor BrkB family protein [Planctomycetota bacterium]|nr:YihY/virulence factor BrkB family protein [Planctomycetota bacterium]